MGLYHQGVVWVGWGNKYQRENEDPHILRSSCLTSHNCLLMSITTATLEEEWPPEYSSSILYVISGVRTVPVGRRLSSSAPVYLAKPGHINNHYSTQLNIP